MVTVGLFIRVEAKPDKVEDVEATLKSVVDQVRAEGKAVAWFGLRLGPTTFAVYDAFANDADRQAHLEANGEALRRAGCGTVRRAAHHRAHRRRRQPAPRPVTTCHTPVPHGGPGAGEGAMKTAHVDDIDIRYELTGAGEPLLLIHGSNIATGLRPLAAALGRRALR